MCSVWLCVHVCVIVRSTNVCKKVLICELGAGGVLGKNRFM